MNLRLFVFVLFGLFLAMPCLCADETGDAKPPPIGEVVRDGDGVIWGIGPRTVGPLYRYADGRWVEAPVPGLAEKKCRALALIRRADGAVVCLWGTSGKERFFSVQRGSQERPSDPITLAYPEPDRGAPCLLADSKNNVWLTNASPYICRLSPDGSAGCVRVLEKEEGFLLGQTAGRPRVAGWEQVLSCEDAQGRVWFHSQGFNSRHALLRGLLVYDGEKFTLRDPLPVENRERRLSVLAPKDAGHLWMGVAYDGLYVLDTATFQLGRVPDQPDEARGNAEVFPRGPDDWVFVFHGFDANASRSLWSLRGGHWEKLADSLDADTLTGTASPRIWERADHGYYLGTSSNGLWFVPDEGLPRQVNWRQGFPVTNPRQLLRLSEPGSWLCVDGNAHVWTGPLDEYLARAVADSNARLRYVRAAHAFVSDGRRRLWGLREDAPDTLGEWDGERWASHALPADGLAAGWDRRPMGVDGKGRVWLADGNKEHKTILIYDPAADHWEPYSTFEDALEAQVAFGKAAEILAPQPPDDRACFGPGGQICYLESRATVAWFDGKAWRHWKRGEIHGPKGGYHFDGPPFFTAAGTLAIRVHREIWEYSAAEDTWTRTATDQPIGTDTDSEDRQLYPPANPVTRTPDSFVLDDQGVYWLTWQGQLYRCRENRCVPVFQPGEVQPFVDGRKLTSVLIDGKGNAFLYSAERHEYVILAPSGPLPCTSIEIAAAREGAQPDTRNMLLRSSAAPVEGKVQFEWRLDGGDWRSSVAETLPATVTLESLRNGDHRFEARSFDAALQTDATPPALNFQVGYDAQKLVDEDVARLADPDDARRKAAVFALAHRPDLALPALQAARAKTTDENQRWWIDAAIQAVGMAKPNATPLPTNKAGVDAGR